MEGVTPTGQRRQNINAWIKTKRVSELERPTTTQR
jgi:hypothetical protein